MKKAIKINLGGMVFHIDEDAYEKLKNYLDLIETHFGRKEGGKEVVSDIESRLAELFLSKLGDGRDVIVAADVEAVIQIMGDPLELAEDEEKEEFYRKTSRSSRQANRRLYRDPDNAVLGGVCSGLAAYFGIDPVVMRIIFFVLLIVGHGVTALVYLIMWIAIPKAVSISQKLEMKGEYVNISNIERSVREELNDVKANFDRMGRSENMNRTRNAIGEILNVFGKIVLIFIKVVLGIIGLSLIFAGIIILFSFLGLFFFKGEMLPFVITSGELAIIPELLSFVVSPGTLTIVLIALFLFITIPLVFLIYMGLKIIFRFRSKDKAIGLIAFIFWVMSIGTLITFAVFEGTKFSNRTPVETVTEIKLEKEKTVYLKLEDAQYPELQNILAFGEAKYKVYFDKEEKKIYGIPRLNIRKSSGEVIEFEVRKSVFGQNQKTSRSGSSEIDYKWRQDGNTIYLSPYFNAGTDGRWKFPEVKLYLRVPEGYNIIIEESLDEILHSVSNVSSHRIWSITGKVLEVKESGIHVVTNGD